MAKLLHPARSVAFQPRDDGPVYHLGVPTVYARSELDFAIGLPMVGEAEVLTAAIDDLRDIGADQDDIDAVEAEIVRYRADYKAMLDPDPRVTEIRKVLRGIDGGRYARAAALQRRYWSRQAITATRLFVVDWDGPPFKPARTRGPDGLDGLDAAAIEAIPDEDRQAIGFRVLALLAPTETEAKNSDSPSPSAVSGSSSTASTTPPRNGH